MKTMRTTQNQPKPLCFAMDGHGSLTLVIIKEQQHLTVADRDILRTVFFASHSMTCEDTIRVCSQWNNRLYAPLEGWS